MKAHGIQTRKQRQTPSGSREVQAEARQFIPAQTQRLGRLKGTLDIAVEKTARHLLHFAKKIRERGLLAVIQTALHRERITPRKQAGRAYFFRPDAITLAGTCRHCRVALLLHANGHTVAVTGGDLERKRLFAGALHHRCCYQIGRAHV